MKYVMIDINIGGVHRELPIIFPELLVHETIASAICGIKNLRDAGAKVVAAGEIRMDLVECWGESTSLEIGSRDNDARVVEQHDHMHGIVMGADVDDIAQGLIENVKRSRNDG